MRPYMAAPQGPIRASLPRSPRGLASPGASRLPEGFRARGRAGARARAAEPEEAAAAAAGPTGQRASLLRGSGGGGME